MPITDNLVAPVDETKHTNVTHQCFRFIGFYRVLMNYNETNWFVYLEFDRTGSGPVISSDRLIPCRSLSEAFTDHAPPLRAYFSMRALHNFKFIAIIFEAFVAVSYERPSMVIVPFAQLSLKLLRLFQCSFIALRSNSPLGKLIGQKRATKNLRHGGLKDISAWIMDEKSFFWVRNNPSRCKM